MLQLLLVMALALTVPVLLRYTRAMFAVWVACGAVLVVLGLLLTQ